MRSMTSEEGESGTVIQGKELYELEVRVHSPINASTNTISCIQAVIYTSFAFLTLDLKLFISYLHAWYKNNKRIICLFLSCSRHVRACVMSMFSAREDFSKYTAIPNYCKID